MDKKKFTNTGDGAIRVDAQYDGSMLNKNGGYHKGQVNDAEKEEMNDNIATGKGPAKPKSVVTARPKSNVELNRDSDEIAPAVPRIADVIKEEKEKKKDPDYKRSKKINKKLLG